MKYLAIIPARGGSKGVKGKNLKLLNGKPLIAWSIEQALDADEIDRVVVTTDSNEIAEIAKKYGADVPFLRPPELATDESPTEPALIHVIKQLEQLEGYQADAIVLLQPTSPLRKKKSLSCAIQQFERERADSLLSVCAAHTFYWKKVDPPVASYDYKSRPRRQDIPDREVLYQENGSIYITKKEGLLRNNNRLFGNITLFEMDEIESYQIDTEIEFDVLNTLVKKYEAL